MNELSQKLYNNLNVYERNVFGCLFDIYSSHKTRLAEYAIVSLTWLYCKWERFIKKDVYFKYLEVPITTRCSLRCRECNNLIQVYQNPKDFDMELIVRDIRHVSSVSKEIRILRVLGGEPLLHPNLGYLLRELAKIEKIKSVRIVTNGTLMFNEECLSALGSDSKFSVAISNYGEHSIKYENLKKQLKDKRIHYITQHEQKPWKAICNCRKRGRSTREIKKAFSLCRDDCHSLLNGGTASMSAFFSRNGFRACTKKTERVCSRAENFEEEGVKGENI